MQVENAQNQIHFLSVDLEDWFTSAYLRDFVKPEECIWQIVESTKPILDLFRKKNVKATFFVLGSVAEHHTQLIKEISNDGHEIASHGYSHIPLWHLNPESFKEEIVRTNNLLQDITGKQVIGFRAPYASLDASTAWAIDVLEEEGFLYDSSIFPMKTILYGVDGAPETIYSISSQNIMSHNPEAKIVEIPFTVFRKAGVKIPCTGGVYGRIFPQMMLRYLLSSVAQSRPINFYFHPWEAFENTPHVKVPLFNRFISYYGNSGYLQKVEGLLDLFRFTTFEDYLRLHQKL